MAARWTRCLALVGPLLVAAVVWAPLRHQSFKADDFFHLYDVVTTPVAGLLGEFFGGHPLVLYNVVFWALFQLLGPDPRGYFYVVLATHLLNTALLYQVVRVFTGRTLLASAGAMLWGACPVLQGTLGWLSVFGQVVSTTLVLGVLRSLGRHLASGAPLGIGLVLGWSAVLAVASTAFGIALGIAAAFPLAVVLAVSPGQLPARSALALVLAAGATLSAYAVFVALSLGTSPTEGIMLLPLAPSTWLPALMRLEAHLIGAGAAALLLDLTGAYGRSPLWVHAAAATLLAALVVTGSADPPMRRRIVALGLLVAAAYAAIAIGRTTLYLALQIPFARAAREGRYHYLPLAILTVLVCTALAGLMSRVAGAARAVAILAGVWLFARVAAAFVWPVPINLALNAKEETAAMLAAIRQQAAATPAGETVVVRNRPFGLTRLFPQKMPGWAGAFVVFFPDNTVDGRPVRFLVSEDDWQRAQARGGRIAALVERE